MGLSSLKNKVVGKIAEKATENLAHKAAAGGFGPTIQSLYIKTLGRKTDICAILFIITAAVAQFTPPWADEYVRLTGLLWVGLGWLGIVDRATRNEPYFSPWLLQGLSTFAAGLTAASAVLLAIAQSPLLPIFLPNDPCASDNLTVISVGMGTVTAFIQRVTKASASLPNGQKPAPNALAKDVIEGQE